MRIKVRVWKVTEYDVTMEAENGALHDLTEQAVQMAEQGHTTDFTDAIGVVDRGTFPMIRDVRYSGSEEYE